LNIILKSIVCTPLWLRLGLLAKNVLTFVELHKGKKLSCGLDEGLQLLDYLQLEKGQVFTLAVYAVASVGKVYDGDVDNFFCYSRHNHFLVNAENLAVL
jgi:hypothetical protein